MPSRIRLRTIVAAIATTITASILALPASAAEYKDPAGFSFTFPDEWIAVNRLNLHELAFETRQLMQERKIDVSRVSVMLLPKDRSVYRSLNVVVEPQQVPIDDNTLQRFTAGLPQQYKDLGIEVADVKPAILFIKDRKALTWEYRMRFADIVMPLRQRQIFFPSDGKTFIVTCTADAETFDASAPKFDEIMETFTAAAPRAEGIDWGEVQRSTILGGIAGGLIGLVLWLVKRGKASQPSHRRLTG